MRWPVAVRRILGLVRPARKVRALERALLESEARSRAVVENAVEGIVTSNEEGIIDSFNLAAQRMFGYSLDEIVGQNVTRLMPEPYAGEHHGYLKRYLSTGQAGIIGMGREVLGKRKDGSTFPMALSVSEFVLDGKRFFTGMVRDVTESRRAERQIRESEERLSLMTDSLPVLISFVDAEQRYQFNNATYENWFGIPKDSLKGRHVRDVIGAQAYESVRGHIEAVLRGQPRTFEGRLPYQGAGLRDVRIDYIPHRDDRGEALGFYALVTDLTRRREMEDALREEQDFVSTLFQTSSALIVVLDGDGNVVRFNRACEELSGYRFEEVKEKSIWQLIPPEQRREVKAVFGALVGGVSHNTFENDWMTKDGARRRIAWSNTAIRDGDGALKYVVAMGIDITARQRAETALRQSREQLRSLSARLLAAEEDERRRLSRELHDSVNQSLGMLAVEAELLMEKTTPSSELRRDLGACRNRILELSESVRRLAYELHPAILDDLGLVVALRSYVDDFARRTGVRVALTSRNVPRSLPKGIASCLYRIAQESLGNAAKHSQSPRITVRLASCRGGYSLMIRDFGRGFDEEAVKDHRRGLGLVSMEERARLEGGRLDVRTSPGRGTHVRVWLPLHADGS